MAQGQPVNASDDDSLVRLHHRSAHRHDPPTATTRSRRPSATSRTTPRRSRIQTFVPIFVEHATHERLAS